MATSAQPQQHQNGSQQQNGSQSSSSPWPLYDLFLDVPHPCHSASCPAAFLIGPPVVSDAGLADELAKNVPQISRFAFPEYDEQQPGARVSTNVDMNLYDMTFTQAPSFQQFTFTLQLSSGSRLHGHVRRYCPPHLLARTRYDVGRRGQRALVLLTRASGADLVYRAVLKSVEAISSQQAATLSHEQVPHPEPQKWFLHQLFNHHAHLAQVYVTRPMEERGKPLICSIEGVELGVGNPLYKQIDTNRFMMPSCLLHRVAVSDPSAAQASSILPLLRCIGVENAVRVMTALMSERRVIMLSSSPTRLATSSHAALAMLAQGSLHWQHLYIPVLPPHLFDYIAAPYPYLVGLLTTQIPRLKAYDGLGEALIINLDTNIFTIKGLNAGPTMEQRYPDIFLEQDKSTNQRPQQQGSGPAATPAALLAADLFGLLKADKRTLYGEQTSLQNVSETAAKAGKALKSGFLKLRDKGRNYLQQRSGSGVSDDGGQSSQEADSEQAAVEDAKSVAGDYIYTEGCHNEVGEEEARIAFTAFFLCMFGNMSLFLAKGGGGQLPKLDRNRFLSQKRALGEGQGTPIWPLLQNFCQTQMFEEFVNARVKEVRDEQPVTPDAPLFLQCEYYHRKQGVPWDVLAIRRIARQVAQSSASRLSGLMQTNARRQAMALTSNRNFDGDQSGALDQLVEDSRESSSVLFDVMSVVWLRLRDSRGMQWKHGLNALLLLKHLLQCGPLAVVAEATDGLGKISSMRRYDNMRSAGASRVREVAREVYGLLVDRARLFYARRVCADELRLRRNPGQRKLVRDRRLGFSVPFKSIHVGLRPANVVPTPASTHPAVPTHNFLDTAASPAAQQQQANMAAAQPTTDMIGLFDNMAVSQTPPQQQQPGTASSQQVVGQGQAPQPPTQQWPVQASAVQHGGQQQQAHPQPTQSYSAVQQQQQQQQQYGHPSVGHQQQQHLHQQPAPGHHPVQATHYGQQQVVAAPAAAAPPAQKNVNPFDPLA